MFKKLGRPTIFSPSSVRDIALDLGSFTTRIANGQQLLFAEPTCIALHKKTGSVVAVGRTAADLYERTPESVEVIFPVRRGKVTRIYPTEQFLKQICKTYISQSAIQLPLRGTTVRVAHSPTASVIQKDFLQRVLKTSGFSRVVLVNKNMALLNYLRSQNYLAPVLCTVDIGGMSTEIGLFAQDGVVGQRSLPLGGEDFTQEVIRLLRKAHQCEVGWQTAERVKQSIGRVTESHEHPKLMVIRGRDSVSSLPKTVQISAIHFDQAFLELAEDILMGIRQLCQDSAPELVTAALDQGIFLTGGGSLLEGIDSFLAQRLQCPVHLSATALTDVVQGMTV